jgi:hypothetical protein
MPSPVDMSPLVPPTQPDLRYSVIEMNMKHPLCCIVFSTLAVVLLAGLVRGQDSPRGPLRVCEGNPRYFSDAGGRAIYLTGSHTWNNLQDMGPTDPPAAFDYEGYLDFLERHHHNFIRLWRWELLRWDTTANRVGEPVQLVVGPHPWARSGPGEAVDGKPRFDLERFHEPYFERLRSRVTAAGDRGMYVAVMLFEGWGLQHLDDGWKYHPFRPANNVNGLDGDVNADGYGVEVHTLQKPAVTAVQEAYVRKVLDTVNDLDNVLIEIANESGGYSNEWQEHMIRFVQDYERTLPNQHPVGMTFPYTRTRGGPPQGLKPTNNEALFASPADWISPNPRAVEGAGYDYRTNPPPGDGSKVILSDTDHLWGVGGDADWVWKSFLRGLNPIFMDPYDESVLGRGLERDWDVVRRAMGHTRRFAERIDLTAMAPALDVGSTGYCLAHPGAEYLIYQPEEGPFTATLAAGTYMVEWFNPSDAATTPADRVTTTSESPKVQFMPPFKGPVVLYLRASR